MKKIIFILFSVVIWCACSENEPGIPKIADVSFSEFFDARDTSTYRCITVGDQTWMAENLHYRLPWGSYQGCYSFLESQADTTDFIPDGAKFYEIVNEVYTSGELEDPDGAMKNYLRYVRFGMWDVVDFTNFYKENYPEHTKLINYIEGVRERLEEEARQSVAIDFLEKAEKKNGGYWEKNGFLYTYEAAKAALPPGWDLPTDEDWKKLERNLGMEEKDVEQMEAWRGNYEGTALKEGGEGIGFNVHMSGGRMYGNMGHASRYQNREATAYFWTATQTSMNDSTNVVVIRKLFYNENRIFRGTSKTYEAAFSVRCIKR